MDTGVEEVEEVEENGVITGDFIPEQVAANAKNSVDFLSALAMPTIFIYLWPKVFKAVWARLVALVNTPRTFSKLALGLPRGMGKTTLIKIFVLYCILFTKKKFILILSANATLAENILADIVDMLDEPNIKATFGDWRLGCEKDTNSLKKFGFRGRNIIIAALGAGGSVRGLNLKNERPDLMIFEDIQTREQADSQQVSEDLYRWMLGTAMKACSPAGCLFIFIANMYPTPHSILKKLIKNKFWIKFVAGAIIQDSQGNIESLWEELHPLDRLIQQYHEAQEDGHPEIFKAEVLNDGEASVNNILDAGKVKQFDGEDTDLHAGNFIIIDPATGKINKDAVAITYFQVHDARPVAWEIQSGAFSPKVCIDIAIKLGMKYNCRNIIIEGVAYQSTLGFWFNWVTEHYGIEGFRCLDIYPGKKSKVTRILELFKQLTSGEVILHPRVWSQVINEARGFNPLKIDNVDNILDCLTYSPRVIAQYLDWLRSGTVLEAQEEQATQELEYSDLDNSSF